MTLHKFFDYLAGFLILFLVMVIAFLVYVKDRNVVVDKLPQDTIVDIDVPETTVPALEGDTANFISASIMPGDSVVKQPIVFSGNIKGGYFFEGNVLLNILDENKNLLRVSHGNAITDWMTVGPVSFAGTIDFTGLPSGLAFIEIHNDNASGLPENDKAIYIPIIIQ